MPVLGARTWIGTEFCDGRLVLGTSNPGAVHVVDGRRGAQRRGEPGEAGEQVTLVSRVGEMTPKARRCCGCGAARASTRRSFTISGTQPTASYTAILESSGELVIGLADMEVYDEITPAVLEPSLERLREHRLWFVDANLPGETIEWLLAQAGEIPVAVDAHLGGQAGTAEAAAAADIAAVSAIPGADCGALGAARSPEAAGGATAGVADRRGRAGIAVWEGDTVRKFAALRAEPRDVTGAGDALVAGTLFGISQGAELFETRRGWGWRPRRSRWSRRTPWRRN